MRCSSSCFGSPDTAGRGDEDVAVLESAVREGWDGYDRRAVAFVDHQVGPDRKLADFELAVADHAPVRSGDGAVMTLNSIPCGTTSPVIRPWLMSYRPHASVR